MDLSQRKLPKSLKKQLDYYESFFKQQKELDLVPRKTHSQSISFRKEGNALYQREKHNMTAPHRMILSLYNQSMAYAPNDSHELALALSNRSALWFHLQKYDLCLNDIEKALRITNSNELKNKLTARQIKCLQLNQSSPPSEKKLSDLPSFKHSESVACAADCIKLDFNTKVGRHYTATRDIKPGEVIIDEKSPYVFVKTKQMYLVCSYCLSFAWDAVPCDSCVYAIYCNKNCKDKAWLQYHDIQCYITSSLECKGMKNMSLFDFNRIVKMVIIAVRSEGLEHILEEVKKTKNEEGICVEDLLHSGKLNCKKFKFLYNLTRAKKGYHEQSMNKCVTIVLSLLRGFLLKELESSKYQIDYETFIMSMKVMMRTLMRVYERNVYGFQSSSCTRTDVHPCTPECVVSYGSIIAPCSSLINHSCDQNVTRICIPGARIVLFALRPIKRGEQICTTYGPDATTLPREARRARLLESHDFMCECKACDEGWPFPPLPPPPHQLESFRSRNLEKLDVLLGNVLEIVETPMKQQKCVKESFNQALEMIDLIYKHFDNQNAINFAYDHMNYIDKCFLYSYGENLDFPESC